MPTTTATTHSALGTWSRLRDGSWGVRVSGTYPTQDLVGATIHVMRRDGARAEVTLGELEVNRAESGYKLFRVAQGEAAPPAPTALVELPIPAESTRTGRMLLAGGVDATVTLPSGEHVTLRIKTRRREGGRWTRCSMLDAGAQVYVQAGTRQVGQIGSGFAIRYFAGTSDAVKRAVDALFCEARGESHDSRVQVADRCGRCGRQLTDPESIDRGVGPECYGHATSSRAAQVVTQATPAHQQAAAEIHAIWRESSLTEMASQVQSRTDAHRDLIAKALRAYAEDEQCEPAQVEAALAAYDGRRS